MSDHFPTVRIRTEPGFLLIRDSVAICFYVRRPHREIAGQVMTALERYADVAGPALGRYFDMEGWSQPLDAAGWAHIREEILDRSVTLVELIDESTQQRRFGFEY